MELAYLMIAGLQGTHNVGFHNLFVVFHILVTAFSDLATTDGIQAYIAVPLQEAWNMSGAMKFRTGGDSSGEGAKIWVSGYYK